MARLAEIEGIGTAYAAKLQGAGIDTVEELLTKGATAPARADLSQLTGISSRLILEWINHADLFRISGIAEEYADLLEAAGVDSVPELAQRNPESLHGKLAEINQEKKLVRQLPTASQVSHWIEQAKSLPRVVMH